MLTFLLYGLLVVLTLVRFERPVRLSAFERERLAAQGDDTARSEKHMLHKLPLVLSVQRLATSLVTVGFIAAALFSLGWWGSAVAVAGLLLLPLVYRVTPLRRAGKKLGEVLWPVTEKVTEWLQPVVHALRPLDARPAPPRCAAQRGPGRRRSGRHSRTPGSPPRWAETPGQRWFCRPRWARR